MRSLDFIPACLPACLPACSYFTLIVSIGCYPIYHFSSTRLLSLLTVNQRRLRAAHQTENADSFRFDRLKWIIFHLADWSVMTPVRWPQRGWLAILYFQHLISANCVTVNSLISTLFVSVWKNICSLPAKIFNLINGKLSFKYTSAVNEDFKLSSS